MWIFFNSFFFFGYLQNITYHAHTPHIGGIGDAIKVYNFGCHEFRSAKKNLKYKIKVGIVLPLHAKTHCV